MAKQKVIKNKLLTLKMQFVVPSKAMGSDLAKRAFLEHIERYPQYFIGMEESITPVEEKYLL